MRTEYCDFYVWQALRNSEIHCGGKRILQWRIRHRSAAQVLRVAEKLFSISAVTLQASLETNFKKHCSSSGNGICSWKHT